MSPGHFKRRPTFQHARQPGRRGFLWCAGGGERRHKEGGAGRRRRPETQQGWRRGRGIVGGSRQREGKGERRGIRGGRKVSGNGVPSQRRADSQG
ncbi:hypothetical protein NDU88_004996 [Pleurodeles waltl]|uniref:Uncharacterized protein n=1 Tax=Pleurodeles waltl TaxID=8319 RepID=A0AAV7T952_PLEWA|nr:hypothetical protein NDU88_004996 [Pleurodeles waltl]